jgi:hypothetical protein
MKIPDMSRCVLTACVAASILSGCGRSQRLLGSADAISQGAAITVHSSDGRSWMEPEARQIKRLLYASDWDYNVVRVYNYDTGKEVGTLTNVSQPVGQCVDKPGDIWITNLTQDFVVEYPHGGQTPIKMLTTDGPGVGCAIDPTTGNLAVVTSKIGSGMEVQVWENASGSPTDYSDETDCGLMPPPGYDPNGNLYVESGNKGSVCELPAGGTALVKVPFDHSIKSSGGVMWDGKYLTFADWGYESGRATAIYRAKRARGGLTVVSITVIRNRPCGAEVGQPFIVGEKNTPANHEQGTVVVGGNTACYYTSPVQYWHYPSGGHPFKHVRPQPGLARGQSVSIAE